MTHHPQAFDQSGQSDPAGPPAGADRSTQVGMSDAIDIGYESADPSLQAPLWQDAIYGLLNRWDRR